MFKSDNNNGILTETQRLLYLKRTMTVTKIVNILVFLTDHICDYLTVHCYQSVISQGTSNNNNISVVETSSSSSSDTTRLKAFKKAIHDICKAADFYEYPGFLIAFYCVMDRFPNLTDDQLLL